MRAAKVTFEENPDWAELKEPSVVIDEDEE